MAGKDSPLQQRPTVREGERDVGGLAITSTNVDPEKDKTVLSNCLKNLIDEVFGGSISEELLSTGQLVATNYEESAQSITEKILESSQMHAFVNRISSSLPIQGPSAMCVKTNALQLATKSEEECYDDEHSYLLYGLLTEDFAKQRLINYCQAVLSSQMPEAIIKDNWASNYIYLRNCLCDENRSVFNLVLKVHAKLSYSSSLSLNRDAFCNLTAGLKLYYSHELQNTLPNFDTGIQFSSGVHQRMVKISSLILKTIKGFAKHLFRDMEKHTEDALKHFFLLLTMHSFDSLTSKFNKRVLYPFHIFSALDPQATWCLAWVKGTVGRNMLFGTMESHMALLVRFLVEQIILYLHMHSVQLQSSTCSLSPLLVKYACFSHCCNILSIILSFERGQHFFQKVKNEPVSLEEFVMIIARHFMTQFDQNFTQNNMLGVKHLKNLLKVVLKKDSKLLNVTEVLRTVVQPFHIVFESKAKNSFFPLQTVELIHTLITSNAELVPCFWGCAQKRRVSIASLRSYQLPKLPDITRSAVGLRRRTGSISVERQNSTKSLRFPPSSSKHMCPAKSILDFTAAMLKSRYISNPSGLILLFEVCGELLKNHEGVLRYKESNPRLIGLVTSLYKVLSSGNDFVTLSSMLAGEKKSCDAEFRKLLQSVIGFFLSLSSTPGGLHFVAQYEEILPDLLGQLLSEPVVPWADQLFRVVLFSAFTLPSVAAVLLRKNTKILADLLCQVWNAYEEDQFVAFGSDKHRLNSISNLLNAVFLLSPSPQGVMALIGGDEDSCSEASTMVNSPGPVMLSELVRCEELDEPYHFVALLCLRALTVDLDSCLYLMNKLNFQASLLHLQSGSVPCSDFYESNTCHNDNLIITESSLLRHQILVSTYIIGGPNECKIPSLNPDSENKYGCHLFYTYPAPAELFCKRKDASCKKPSELQVFLKETRFLLRDSNWLAKARKAYRTSCIEEMKLSVIIDLMGQVSKCNENKFPITWRQPDSKCVLGPEDALGVELSIRYGVNLGILQCGSCVAENLKKLLCSSPQHQQHSEGFKGFDWLLATMYLLCSGNMDRCQNVIQNLSGLPVMRLLWPSAYHETISELSYNFGHQLESVISVELPCAFRALKAHGVCWWVICQQWMAQCFWNVLDWPQICHWLVLCILHPPDFALYYCVSMLQHLQPRILDAVNFGSVWDSIKIRPIKEFRISNHIQYIEKLAKRHRTTVLQHLLLE